MTIRRLTATATAAVGAVLAAAPGLAGQTIPDSLRYLRLPADPAEFVHEVSQGWYEDGTGQRGSREALALFAVGCPADGGWAGDAYTALVEAAETDFSVRRELVRTFANVIEWGEVCLTELSTYRTWLVERLREEWEDGLLSPDDATTERLFGTLIYYFTNMANPTADAYALLRQISRDPNVHNESDNLMTWDGFEFDIRRDAAFAMVQYHIRNGKSEAEAFRAVVDDLEGGPPNRNFYEEANRVIAEAGSG